MDLDCAAIAASQWSSSQQRDDFMVELEPRRITFPQRSMTTGLALYADHRRAPFWIDLLD